MPSPLPISCGPSARLERRLRELLPADRARGEPVRFARFTPDRPPRRPGVRTVGARSSPRRDRPRRRPIGESRTRTRSSAAHEATIKAALGSNVLSMMHGARGALASLLAGAPGAPRARFIAEVRRPRAGHDHELPHDDL
jgi:hypothetical protein